MASVKRNDPCPCGSNRKYKQCCGKGGGQPAAPPVPAIDPMVSEADRLRAAGQVERARPLYVAALQADANCAPALAALGEIEGQRGGLSRGAHLLRRAVALDGRHATWHLALAHLELETNEPEAALASVEAALALDAKLVRGHVFLAQVCERLRRPDDARAAAKRAVALAPRDANAVIMLASLDRKAKRYEAARAQLESLLRRLDDPAGRRWACHELGMTCDRLGTYADAWGAFQEAGAMGRRLPHYARIDLDFVPRRARAMPVVGTAARFARWAAAPPVDPHPDPAFLVGFPRSGTTMTEQVLAAHPGVVSLDERPVLDVVADRAVRLLGSPAPDDVDFDRLSAAQRSALRGLYWQEVRTQTGVAPGAGLILDKLPLNLLQLPLIGFLFPAAPIVVALRDPRDVCLSAFMQHFQINAAMAHFTSFEGAARLYASVMGAYLAVRPNLGAPWIEVRYEETVRDLETVARRMLDLLGLDWHPDVLRFHERAGSRVISTPSAAAVTEPVHGRAVARWRRYEAFMGDEALAVLEPLVQSFGYEH